MIALTFRPSRRSWRSSPRSGSFRLATSSLARCSWVDTVALAARYLASVAGVGHGSTSSHAPRSATTWTMRTLPDVAPGAISIWIQWVGRTGYVTSPSIMSGWPGAIVWTDAAYWAPAGWRGRLAETSSEDGT